MPNTASIPPSGGTWARLDLADILSRPTASISISQNNSVYSPEGAQGGEKQYERRTLENTVKVAKAARKLGAHFFGSEPLAHWDQVRREWDGELTSILQKLVQPGDAELKEIARQSSFVATNLEWHLRRNNIQTIILTGIHLDWCIEGKARQARDLGYMPIVVGDASSRRDAEEDGPALQRINAYFAPTLSTDNIVELIDQVAARKRSLKNGV